VVAADQLAKAAVRASLLPGASFPAGGPFRFTHVTNTGAAFGLFAEQGSLLTLVGLAAVLVLVWYYRSFGLESNLVRASLGLQLGGALGNLIDRLRQGYVTDFLDFRIWPVFNLADAALTMGVALLFFVVLFQQKPSRPR
jgi:signal peptidase II